MSRVPDADCCENGSGLWKVLHLGELFCYRWCCLPQNIIDYMRWIAVLPASLPEVAVKGTSRLLLLRYAIIVTSVSC
jgi:hypothetical protein